MKPHLKKQWCIGKLTPLFLWRMEKILDLYEQPYNPRRPLICFDERPCQLIDDILVPIPMKPGRTKKQDYHYKRNGTCCILIAVEPLTARLFIQVRKRRTKKDYAEFMKTIAKFYKKAEEILVVQDNLNTHNPSSFYERFPAEEAFELAERFEMHYTPTSASWLNMVEIAISVLSKQCLDRRIPDIETMKREVKAWAKNREYKIEIDWRYTKNDARISFKKFYPIHIN